MSKHLDGLKGWIVEIGIFLVFLATFGEYVVKKVWAVIGPLFAFLFA